MRKLALAVIACVFAFPALAEESAGTITISVAEYERLKKATEAEGEQYWDMTFQQILEKERGNEAKAWEKYEFYVLRRLHLDTAVSDSSVAAIIADLNVMNEISDKPVTLVINSPGGGVFAGLNLYNAMMASRSPVNTVCDGMAASMAAVLLSAGAHRTANDGCAYMMHEVGAGAPGGQTTDHIKWTDMIVSVENLLLQILSENSGLSMADVRTLGEFETFWNAEETLALGFVDEVTGGKPRDLAAGSRGIPSDLLPKKRIARQIAERMGQ